MQSDKKKILNINTSSQHLNLFSLKTGHFFPTDCNTRDRVGDSIISIQTLLSNGLQKIILET